MPERVVPVGRRAIARPSAGWVLVFGGVTREGNRRARRAVRAALESGRAVVWFDGYNEVFEDNSDERVRLDSELSPELLTVVDYSAEERAHWLIRIGESAPRGLINQPKPGGPHSQPDVPQSDWVRRVRRSLVKAALLFQKLVVRRVSQIFRGMIGWNLVKNDVNGLAGSGVCPSQIVYGDEFALTQAWHAVRIWPDIRAGMELKI